MSAPAVDETNAASAVVSVWTTWPGGDDGPGNAKLLTGSLTVVVAGDSRSLRRHLRRPKGLLARRQHQ